MSGDPRATSDRLLRDWAREPGRSVLARVETPGGVWEGAIDADTPRPAASLLKVPLGLATEDAFANGDLDPGQRVSAGSLAGGRQKVRPLSVLRPDVQLSAADVLGLCLVLSDGACSAWLLAAVGLDRVRAAAAAAGCTATTIAADPASPGGPLTGSTTARDALRLVAATRDAVRYPLSARALEHTVHNARIPLGATGADVGLAHKTGTLHGVANDVAVLDCDGGTLSLALLTDRQHDTLVSGYEMGILTRGLLEAWSLGVRRARSLT
jgi:beta-lactamase class A